MSPSACRPPWIARLLLRLLVWGPAYEVIAGDLEEEYTTRIRPRLGRLRSQLWFALETGLSILAFYRLDLTAPRPPRQGDHPMFQDLGYGLRMLRKNLGFTTAAVLTLALGIGANTAIFSIVHTFLLRPLAYREASQVVFVLGWNTAENEMRFNLRFADFADLEAQSSVFSSVAAYRYRSVNLTGRDVPERVQAYEVTAGTFDLLGVEPLRGRTFAAEESEAGKARVAVLSYGLWQRRFGSDPAVVGRDVVIDGESYTVVGVMPRSFDFPIVNFKGDLWVPMTDDVDRALADRTAYGSIVAVARLRPSVSVAAAQAEVDTLMERLAADHPETNTGLGARVIPMRELLSGVARPALLVAFAAVTLVLLMACANVANLLLARAASRRQELAVRTVLGAGSSRLARQLLTECLILSAAGGALGLGVAFGFLRAMQAALPEVVLSSVPGIEELGVNEPTLVFALALSFLTGILFGIVPALKAARSELHDHLREGTPGSGQKRQRLRRVLVAGQVALSLLLLVVSGLLARSFQKMVHVDPGFRAENVVVLSVSLPGYRYESRAERLRFYERVAEGVRSLPGVVSAGWVDTLPFSTYNNTTSVVFEGRPEPAPGEVSQADRRVVDDGYLATLSIPVLRGRGILAGDRSEAPPVVLVNQAFAELHFPNESPLGRRLRLGRDPGLPWHEVVGVVGDVKHWELTRAARPEVYLPLAQRAGANMSLAVRTARPAKAMTALVQAEIRRVDPEQPVFHAGTLEDLVADSHLLQTSAMVMMSVFAVLALVLAALGLYGVIAFAVSQRTREIGIRMALGARSRYVLAAVLREGMVLVAIGSAAGLAGAWGLTRFLAGLLYGVTPLDPATFLLSVPILGAVALLSCLLPARRAARVDPVVALRAE